MNLSSGYPFWLIKNGLPFNYPKLENSLKTDIVILGAGITGALMSYCLTQANIEHVVVDARSVGLGSTCASTALLQYEIDVPLSKLEKKTGFQNALRAYQLCAESITDLATLAKKIKYKEFEYKQSLYYAAYKKDLPSLKEEFNIRKRNGFSVSFLDEKDVHNEYNFSAPGAILSSLAAQIDAYSFSHALHQFCVDKGSELYDRTPIKRTEHRRNGITLTTEKGHTIRAKKIIYATGYEVVEMIDKKIVDLQSTYAIISEQTNERKEFWKNNDLIWNTADPYLYMRSCKDRILIGGRDEQFSTPSKRDELILSKRDQLVRDFRKLFPDQEFKPEFSWTGTFGTTTDGLPFIGEYKPLKNSFFALGFGGNGITFSAIAAKVITEKIKGTNNSDLKIFSFDRV